MHPVGRSFSIVIPDITVLEKEMQILAMPGISFTPFIKQCTLALIPAVDDHFQCIPASLVGLGGINCAVCHRVKLTFCIDDAVDAVAGKTVGFHAVQNCSHDKGDALGTIAVASKDMLQEIV